MKITSYRLEEEKMAVIIQKMVGTRHTNRFYPDFSGVAKSHNYYPILPQKSADGIVSVALGLGTTIVDGGNTVRFCPKYPKQAHPYSSVEEQLQNSQDGFFALDMHEIRISTIDALDPLVLKHTLDQAEVDDSLRFVGSTYSPENDAIYDGLSRQGVRLVTFAPILKDKIFPLPQIVELLLDTCRFGMGAPVEMEFAVNMSSPSGMPHEFEVLQVRPMVLSRESEVLNVDDVDPGNLICRSGQVLGNGIIHLKDMVVVDSETFDRAKTLEVATEIGRMNEKLLDLKHPYLLLGVGRWGTLDPWLGIPVKYDQICGARVIIEAGLRGSSISPSQGSHFFQNITSFMVGYFTVQNKGFVDWDWIRRQTPVEQGTYIRHYRFDGPMVVKMNGHSNQGIVLKPNVPPETE